MLRVLEFLTNFNWLFLPLVFLETLLHANWRRAYHHAGATGILREGVRSALGTNTAMFCVPLNGWWSGREIQRLLRNYNIELWGYGFAYGQLFFHVRREEAELAEIVMLQAGVELV